MKLLKSLWRKLLKQKTGAFETVQIDPVWLIADKIKWDYTEVYDPATDEHKIMSGEVESYFE